MVKILPSNAGVWVPSLLREQRIIGVSGGLYKIKTADGETVLCVSSNGTIRFAPHITGDYAGFCAEHDIKVATGGVCIFTSEDGTTWSCKEWGVKAFKQI